jgi:hypothetical protein
MLRRGAPRNIHDRVHVRIQIRENRSLRIEQSGEKMIFYDLTRKFAGLLVPPWARRNAKRLKFTIATGIEAAQPATLG